MSLKENFNEHSKHSNFYGNVSILNERKKIFNKIYSNNFDKRNNESLKNLPISDLTSFKYYFKPQEKKPKIFLREKNIYEINVINGTCDNYEDDNIEIRNVLNEDFEKIQES
ncbi:hypothetical protein IDH28_04420, partial [Pelagibacterales bacterium SAG-MED31]|nr:hypothetical protein [Pelagibacterales bacterium SAG-MED31]